MHEAHILLKCGIVYNCRHLPTFQNNFLLNFMFLRWNQQGLPKSWLISIRVHAFTTQKTIFFTVSAMRT